MEPAALDRGVVRALHFATPMATYMLAMCDGSA
jgi:hypothetical protein